jgi:YVTN family beta-propeller protein
LCARGTGRMLPIMVRRFRERGLVTLLFTDIVGSSEIAVELGDHRWRALQSRHHGVVRRQLKRHGGKEIDTAGDGFFATFESPASGVRCASAIVSEMRELGLDIRAGLHIGEVELIGEKVSGIAVTIAARICALAGPGQVLVSETIAQMVAGSGLGFAEIGPRDLKGVPGRWQLYALVAVDGKALDVPLDTGVAMEARERASPPLEQRQRGRMVSLGIAATVLAIAGLGVFAWSRSSAPPTPTPSVQTFSGVVVVRVDLNDGTVLPVDVPNVPFDVPAGPVVLTRPGGLAGQSFAWILSAVPTAPRFELTQVNRASGNVVARQPTRGCSPPKPCLAVADHRVWITVSSARPGVVEPGIAVEGIDVTGAKDPRFIPASTRSDISSVGSMVFGNQALWVSDTLLGLVTRVDLKTGESQAYSLPGGVDSLAFGERDLWVVDRFKGLLERFDPDTRRVTGDTGVPGDPTSVAVGGGYVWVTDGSGNSLEKIPTSLAGPTPIVVGGQPVAVVYAGGAVWVANHDDGTVSKVDPNTSEVVQTYPVGIHPSSIAVDGNELWVAGNPSGIDRS